MILGVVAFETGWDHLSRGDRVKRVKTQELSHVNFQSEGIWAWRYQQGRPRKNSHMCEQLHSSWGYWVSETDSPNGWKHALESCKRAEHSEGRVVTDGLEVKQALATLTEASNQMDPKIRQYKERRKKKSCKWDSLGNISKTFFCKLLGTS